MRGPDRTIQYPLPGERVRVRGSGRTIQYPLPYGERVRVRGPDRTGLHVAPGGIDSLRSRLLGPSMGLAPLAQRRRCSKTLPAFLCGQPAHCVRGLSNWLRQLSNTQSGVLIPPSRENIKEKSPYFRTSSSLNMAVREGFEPSIRCRIHTFQACSFSHSDTSPYCLPVVDGTGANVRKSRTAVNLLFQ